MPYQKFNYAGIPPHIINGPLHGVDFGALLRQGMQLRHEPQRLLQEREQSELSNRLGQQQYQMQEARLPYAPELAQAEVEKMRADAEKARSLAAIGGMQFPGGAGLVQGHEAIKRIYGENSPQAKYAQLADDLLLNQRKSGLGRIQSEIDDLSSQLSNPNLSGTQRETIQNKRNQLENKAFNEQSDLDVRQKGLGAKLMEQTWNTFISGPSMDALKKYTGPKGRLNFYKDSIKYNLNGVAPNEDFDNYLAARNELYTLSDQYMKAFPGSTNYKRMESIQKHVNPESALMPPGALESSIRSTWKVIEPELKTYTDVLHGKNPLRRGGAHNETIEALNKNTKKQNYSGKTRNLNLETGSFS
ncbi:hypothetical protein UFOVP270_29 [uncultured Caudovirales phage]|uniref:Uncharacterized protein n=1 Tax=uncultured Caudovirales phage TaxID=2100421 RepID=A0A6J5L509_9CAUD|nr:hypothetical protein UFOVP101_27 [uncultured Caudovirales phage]CAB4134203.1 hypothetical protein UFOVP270_29 [uncultured Caudovirales phage]